MVHRRDFLRAAIAGAAGAYANGRQGLNGAAAPQPSSPERRHVLVGGRRIKVIDVHAHCVIPVTEIVKSTPLANAGSGRGNLGPDRLKIMDQQGVDVQALSINGYWWYAADRGLASRIVLAQNEGLAKWVSAHADRFVALASVALQYPDLAAEQLHDAVTRLGMRGTSIGGHVNGEDLSLPKYDPFWAKAAELGALVFMHPGSAINIIKEGAFAGRGDLYYRLTVFPLHIPPLRERRDDIPRLATHLVALAAKKLGTPPPRISEQQCERLQRYDWPGNVRELQNLLERAVILSRDGKLYLDPAWLPKRASDSPRLSQTTTAAEVVPDTEWRRRERQNLETALQHAGGRIYGPKGAAELLGVKPTTLQSRLRALGIRTTDNEVRR